MKSAQKHIFVLLSDYWGLSQPTLASKGLTSTFALKLLNFTFVAVFYDCHLFRYAPDQVTIVQCQVEGEIMLHFSKQSYVSVKTLVNFVHICTWHVVYIFSCLVQLDPLIYCLLYFSKAKLYFSENFCQFYLYVIDYIFSCSV